MNHTSQEMNDMQPIMNAAQQQQYRPCVAA